jgi:hypothetical protein
LLKGGNKAKKTKARKEGTLPSSATYLEIFKTEIIHLQPIILLIPQTKKESAV